MDEIDQALRALLAEGERRGFVTWPQLNALLARGKAEPTLLDRILRELEARAIDVRDEGEANGQPPDGGEY